MPNLHLLLAHDHGWKHHCGRDLADVPEGYSIPLQFFAQYQAQLCPGCAQWPHPPDLKNDELRIANCERKTSARRHSHFDIRHSSRTAETEKAFMARVIAEAQRERFLSYHTFNSRRSQKGFLDLVLAKPEYPLYVWELKSDTGKVTPEQAIWLEVLPRVTSVEAHLWRPQDWEEIVHKLH